jgi:hypothetical protein
MSAVEEGYCSTIHKNINLFFCADFHQIWYQEVLHKFVDPSKVWLISDKNDGHFTWRLTMRFCALKLLGADAPGYLGYHGYYVYLGQRSKVAFWRKLHNLYAKFHFVICLMNVVHVKCRSSGRRSEARALIARTLDRGFESRLRHGCLSSSFYAVLSCVGRGFATSWSLVQGVLPYVEID